MKKSPFTYGVTVSDTYFTNREQEIKRLFSNLTNGINTMIISPRRWGKSSLVEKVSEKITKKKSKHRVILIDLFSTASEQEFLEQFAVKVIKASSTKWEDWVDTAKNILKSITPHINLGVDPISDFSLSFDWRNSQKNINDILNLPEKIAEEKGIKFIICIDEFQNLATFDSFTTFEKKMRAIWQRQSHVTYCLYGSKRHMMLDIFDNSSKPFYRFGDIILLPKIQERKWVSFITEGFNSTGKSISDDLAKEIARTMDNHPWYVQQLSHYTWTRTAGKVTKNILTAAIEELLATNSPFYLLEVDNLSKTQLNLLRAISKNEEQLTGKSTMDYYSLGTPNNVTKNRRTLEERDLIYLEDGYYRFLDSVFELWFRREFE